jgi:crotonobetainyl-CoA:carnitine CoA-transferase CaiB-like acyl-CoA transferase
VADRRGHEDELDEHLAGWTGSRKAADVVRELRSVGVPAAAVARPQERIEDPETAGFGLWPEVDHPVIGPIAVDGLPFHLSETDWSITAPAPCVGQHTDQVLGGLLGLVADELAQLRADGVV